MRHCLGVWRDIGVAGRAPWHLSLSFPCYPLGPGHASCSSHNPGRPQGLCPCCPFCLPTSLGFHTLVLLGLPRPYVEAWTAQHFPSSVAASAFSHSHTRLPCTLQVWLICPPTKIMFKAGVGKNFLCPPLSLPHPDQHLMCTWHSVSTCESHESLQTLRELFRCPPAFRKGSG